MILINGSRMASSQMTGIQMKGVRIFASLTHVGGRY